MTKKQLKSNVLENAWRLWAKSLGQKASQKNEEADRVALIRSVIFLTYLITNIFICAGVVRHWNDETQVLVEIHQEQPTIPMIKTNFNQTGQFE